MLEYKGLKIWINELNFEVIGNIFDNRELLQKIKNKI
jgi:hypothetical protein